MVPNAEPNSAGFSSGLSSGFSWDFSGDDCEDDSGACCPADGELCDQPSCGISGNSKKSTNPTRAASPSRSSPPRNSGPSTMKPFGFDELLNSKVCSQGC